MSSESPPSQGGPAGRQRWFSTENARPIALGVLAILATLFAVFNLGEVKVDWVVGSGQAPLIIVIVISLLVGILVTHFAERRNRQR